MLARDAAADLREFEEVAAHAGMVPPTSGASIAGAAAPGAAARRCRLVAMMPTTDAARPPRRRRVLRATLLGAGLLVAYLCWWPLALDPRPFAPAPAPDLAGALAPNAALATTSRVADGLDAPEDVALDREGRPITGTVDGRILRLDPRTGTAELLATTGGRPLGLAMAADGTLYIADGEQGLLALAAGGRLGLLADSCDGRRIGCANDVAIAPDGTVLFTDSSRLPVRDHAAAIIEHRDEGSLLAYDPRSGAVRRLADGLAWPNGVAIAPGGGHALVAETASYRLRRVELAGAAAGSQRIVADNLPGFPDGIAPASAGGYWLAIAAPRNALLDRIHPSPFLKRVALRLPRWAQPAPRRYALVLRVDDEGRVLESLHDPAGGYAAIANVVEDAGGLWFGSFAERGLGRWTPAPR